MRVIKSIMRQSAMLMAVFLLSSIWCQGQEPGKPAEVMTGKQFKEQIFTEPHLPANFEFKFPFSFKEVNIYTKDHVRLHALFFEPSTSKGIILYLHGSNGALDVWGKVAPIYTSLGYALLMPDYRGYGKSEGANLDEKQVCDDVQDVYNYIRANYPEKEIVVLGQSIGTGPAAYLAAHNHPKRLILQAPYYSIEDWVAHVAPELTLSDNLFHFKNYEYIQQASCPITLIHGDADSAIYYASSLKLREFLKPGDELITLKGEGHNDFTLNNDYKNSLKRWLK